MANRFPAKPTWIDGHRFPSRREARRYGDLKLLLRAGKIANLSLQPSFKVKIKGKHLCTYTADFSYDDLAGGQTIIEEIKSSGTRRDPYYRLRKKAAELYHEITIQEIVAR